MFTSTSVVPAADGGVYLGSITAGIGAAGERGFDKDAHGSITVATWKGIVIERIQINNDGPQFQFILGDTVILPDTDLTWKQLTITGALAPGASPLVVLRSACSYLPGPPSAWLITVVQNMQAAQVYAIEGISGL